MYLLVTGIPLQFSGALQLGTRYVSAAWVLDWYGLQAPESVTGSGPAVQVGQWLYLEDRAVTTMSRLVGAVQAGEFLLVAGTDELLVLHPDAAAPERTDPGADITGIGLSGDTPYLQTSAGLMAADDLLLNWQPAAAPAEDINWAAAARLPDAAAASYRERFRQRMLSVERWLQDLHSGRFFGSVGILIVDIASALLLVLAGTGLVLWWRYSTSRS